MGRILEWLLGLEASQLEGADSWFPAFAADYNNWVILGAFVLFAALVALTVMSYLREGDHSRRVKLTIASIRIAVLALIVVVLMQPELILRYRKDHYYTVAVLLDNSLSMSLTDRYADADLRKTLSEALGADEEELAKLERQEIVRRLLTRQGGPLAELAKEHRLLLLRFSTNKPGQEAYTRRLEVIPCGAVTDAEADQIETAISEAFGRLDSSGYETNLAAALRGAAKKLQGQRVAGIVLISDGQPTGATNGANRMGSAMAHLRKRGIRVAAIGVGDDVPPQNLAVLQLQGPVEARRGSTIEWTAHLAHRNCGGQSVQVKLWRRGVDEEKWTDTGVSKIVTLSGEGREGLSRPQEVQFRLDAATIGEFIYKAEVDALDREFSADDNFATAKIKVTDEKVKILLISGDGGWEFQYLRDFLLRSPDRYAVSVWQQDAELKFNQEASSKDMRLTHLPRTRGELYRYEVVILYDPAHTENGFDGAFVSMLDGFIGDYHGGLCYIASNKHSDLNLTGEDDVFRPLTNVLPVELDRQALNIAERIHQTSPVAWSIVPTAAGQEHPVLRFGRTPQETLEIWDLLPGSYWSHPVRRLKPLATPLAVSADRTDLVTAGGSQRAPLIAVQYYGKGRSLYIGFDETWRWRALSRGVFHRRFWSNVVDFLSAGRFQQKRVIIATGADKFSVGEEMTITAEVYDSKYQPLAETTFTVTLLNIATGEVERVELGRGADDGESKSTLPPGHYRKKITLKNVGAFRLTVDADEGDYKDDVAEKTIQVALPAEEFKRPEADSGGLMTITGGRFLRIQAAHKLPALVAKAPKTVFNDVPHSLWDTPLTMILIVLLLAVEWIARKKYNMT